VPTVGRNRKARGFLAPVQSEHLAFQRDVEHGLNGHAPGGSGANPCLHRCTLLLRSQQTVRAHEGTRALPMLLPPKFFLKVPRIMHHQRC
jgi:hypothetical protein